MDKLIDMNDMMNDNNNKQEIWANAHETRKSL